VGVVSKPVSGHIELERTVESIIVGARHRRDFGDLDALVASIDRLGLLQPITVTLDGVLICGARRLAAIKRLGWRTVNVWVSGSVSDKLGMLLAEQDDNALHKPLNDLEAAALYREIKMLIAQDATRRQAASQFAPGTNQNPRSQGSANLAEPEPGQAIDARAQAASMVTGRASYTTLERVNRLQVIAADESKPEHVRQRARAELARVQAGGSVYPSHLRMKAELSLADLDRIAADPAQPEHVRAQAAREAATVRAAQQAEANAAELDRLASVALANIEAARKGKRRKPTVKPEATGERTHLPVTVFLRVWNDMDGWWDEYDAAYLADVLTDDQWTRYVATIERSVMFTETISTARTSPTARTA
jgi:ParB family chromosome partitioning protein